MFVLRIIEESRKHEFDPFSQVVENHELGKAYSKLEKGITPEFEEVMKYEFPDEKSNSVKAIILGENGDSFFISENTDNRTYSYFIMTENGSTFERISNQ